MEIVHYDNKKTKKIVKRGVNEVNTPGVSLNDEILDKKENNFLAAINLNKNQVGVAFLDISTGEFLVGEGSFDYSLNLLQTFNPKEILDFSLSKFVTFKLS